MVKAETRSKEEVNRFGMRALESSGVFVGRLPPSVSHFFTSLEHLLDTKKFRVINHLRRD
ncbi:hypothetical protein KIN20_009994 [Parelaphostrongylus tenuis]|uniref:Uncharacterized protein n=1 Tax=Parelaphostrongylus tenuis TaxID=148309 RepID=A0AAD5MYG5_PARTN|nr:hypothetical protein KIN20_009994 [Parelaphostrongylus tenuis]